ncbi:hypothetical protein FHS83_002489 [Rhizomicrobium palustre]|uniref:Uncharacterized protein n=1 Tax=Rhizomicrobium palustre TaxID=189966 RepID=A0A846N1H1_9PROT|nr:hypothetical protein [Rhizomicrobium palustre]NIK89171.1 hypothetical protein [Rhizomicrobium palustre]
MPKSRNRKKKKSSAQRTNKSSAQQSNETTASILIKFLAPIGKLWKIVAGAVALLWTLYFSWQQAIPEVHLDPGQVSATTHIAFYIEEKSPLVSAVLTHFDCVGSAYRDVLANTIDTMVIGNPLNTTIGSEKTKAFYDCRVELGIPLNQLAMVGRVNYRLKFFGLLGPEQTVESLPVYWPTDPSNPHWSEGVRAN